MLKNYMGLILLGEEDESSKGLTQKRSIGSIPIGGRYRVIDFPLSSLAKVGVKNVAIYTNKANDRSLIDHIGSGKPWDLDRTRDGIFIFPTSRNEAGKVNDLYNLKNNLEHFYRSKEENIIITSSHMVCNIDLEEMIEAHEASDVDITIAYKKVKNADTNFMNCDTLAFGEDRRVLNIGKNTNFLSDANISMEIFILSKKKLVEFMVAAVQEGRYRDVKDAISILGPETVIKGFEFKGYLKCINSINEYVEFHQEILDRDVRKNLFFGKGKIYTKSKDTPPSKFFKESKVLNSFIANGCSIKGNVKNSTLARRVTVEEGAELENCIILEKCIIGKNAKLKNIILDKKNVIGDGEVLMGSREFPVVVAKKDVTLSSFLKK